MSETSLGDSGLKSPPRREVTGIRRLVMLDRYAMKHPDPESAIRKGIWENRLPIVVANISDDVDKPQIVVGHAVGLRSDGFVGVRLEEDGKVYLVPLGRVAVPTETTLEDIWERMALAIVQHPAYINDEGSYDQFRWLLDDFRFVPAGRIWAGLGTGYERTLINCFVFPIEPDGGPTEKIGRDSRQAILDTLHKMVETMSRGGGVGLNLGVLRPKGAVVRGVAGHSSGSVSWGDIYSFTTGLISQGGCFASMERIATDKGLLPAQEVAQRIKTGESFMAMTHEGPRPIVYAFENGRKPVFEVETSRGLRLRVTEDHGIAVFRDGEIVTVPLRDLNVGDEVLTLLGDGAVVPEIPLMPPTYEPSVMSTTLNESVTFPETLNEELAYFLGYAYGNGYVHVGKKANWSAPKALKLSVPDDRPEIRERLIELSRKLFGIESSIEDKVGSRSSNVALYSRLLMEWLAENGLMKEKAADIRVPEAIFRSSSRIMGAFVSGYFDADGSDRGRKGGYGFDSISRTFLGEIQQILALNGIASHVSETKRPEPWQTIYRLSITGADFKARASDFMSLSLKLKSHPGKRSMGPTYPLSAVEPLGLRYKHYRGIWDGKINPTHRALERVSGRLKAVGEVALADRLDSLLRVLPDTIVSITEAGMDDTYDFEVEEVHLLSGGGIYTSNSRRGALLELMPVWHPDVKEFIQAKLDPNRLTNCNISVGLTKEFEDAVREDRNFDLVFPDLDRVDRATYNLEWDGDISSWVAKGLPVKVYETVRARDLFRMIVESAWASAEPGIIRLDYMNSMSNSWYYSPLIGTNPCGEQALPAYGVCNLGHINLSRFVTHGPGLNEWVMDWDGLRSAVRLAVRFLDAIIDLDPYHLQEVKAQQLSERRIGLGTMGLAELLIRLQLRYGSPESLEFIDKLYRFIRDTAYLASIELAKELRPFPSFDPDGYLASGFVATLPDGIREQIREHGIRNVTLLTQAPTGSVGTMAGTSTGIEPYFQFRYLRSGRLGQRIEVVEPIIQELAEEIGSDPLDSNLDYLVTAMDLTPEDHIRVQAAIQKYVDASISKTANLPAEYTVDQTEEIYNLALELGCKGVTVYRDQSRQEQVLSLTDEATDQSSKEVIEGTSSSPLPDRPPVHRPGVVEGYTERVKTPVGKVYVTTNFDGPDPIEVFVKGPAQKSLPGEAEGMLVPREQYEQALVELAALTEALGIVLSEAMKWGASPERLARQLSMAKGTFFFHKDDHTEKGVGLRGITAAVAHAMQEAMRLRNQEDGATKYIAPIIIPMEPPSSGASQVEQGHIYNPCPECGTEMIKTDCWYCPECGYSKCG